MNNDREAKCYCGHCRAVRPEPATLRRTASIPNGTSVAVTTGRSMQDEAGSSMLAVTCHEGSAEEVADALEALAAILRDALKPVPQ